MPGKVIKLNQMSFNRSESQSSAIKEETPKMSESPSESSEVSNKFMKSTTVQRPEFKTTSSFKKFAV